MAILSEKNLVSEIIEENIEKYVGRTLWMTVYDSKADLFYPYQDVRPAAFTILPEILNEIELEGNDYNKNEFQKLIKKYMRVMDTDGKFKKKNSRLLLHRNKRDMGVFETEEDALKWYLTFKADRFRFKEKRIAELTNELKEVNEFIESQEINDSPDWSYYQYLREVDKNVDNN